LEKKEKPASNLRFADLSGRRASIIEALNKSVEIFTAYKEKTFEEVMTNGIRPFADAVGLDRVVFYKFVEIEKGKRLGQVYRWDKSEGGLMSLAEELKVLPNLPVLENWISITSKGKCVRLRKSDYTEDMAAFMRVYNILSILMVPIIVQGEFWGDICFQDHTNDCYFDEDCADLLYSAARIFATAVIKEETKRREEMEAALNRAAIMFLSHGEGSFEYTMTAGVNEIADAFKLDRFSLLRNFSSSGGMNYAGQIYRWDRSSGGTTAPIKGLELFSPDQSVPTWRKIFTSGGTINGSVKLMPEAALLQSYGLVSVCVTPVYINNFFWGVAFFEDLHKERFFEKTDIEMLRSAAFLCANAVIRAEMEKDIREQGEQLKIRLKQQELISELSRGFISSGDSQTLVKEAIAKLGCYHNVTLVFVFAMDYQNKDTHLAYHWCADSEPPRNAIANLFHYLSSIFPETLPESATVPIVTCDNTAENPEPIFQVLHAIDVLAIIAVPLYVDGHLWGIMAVEQNATPRQWTNNEKKFIAMTGSTIAGIIMRDIYTINLKEALSKAMEASRAKSEFLSNMSHEIRTPLNAITGMTTIGRNAKDMERKDYALEKIEDASTHLLSVINDVLDMSKIEANMLQLSPGEFSFEKMLQKVVAVINFRVEEKRQKFFVNIDNKIPQNLIADDQRLAQVITNLLSNAIKFTPEEGSIILNANLIKEEKDLCTIQVSVSDTGIGISEEQQKRLFSSFQQAESSTTRKYGGTGLGLAISKNIVEMMGGTIWIESEPGKGSTFNFTIQATRGVQGRQMRLPEADLNNVNIMAVDDDPDILTYFLDITQRYGVSCETATSGEKALELVDKKDGPQIYFVDWKMPTMDGIQLAREIKARNPENSVVIMISAVEWSTIAEEAKAAGVDKFLSKPLFPSNITDVINECLGVDKRQVEKTKAADIVGIFAGRHVLLVEDVEINREIVQALLEPTQLEIECAENGVEAVRLFIEAPHKYDIIFMDVQMPEMDGYEATRRIRAVEAELKKKNSENSGMGFRRRIPIIAMTANVFKEDIEKCFASGMDSHVGKPLDFDEVMNRLHSYLG